MPKHWMLGKIPRMERLPYISAYLHILMDSFNEPFLSSNTIKYIIIILVVNYVCYSVILILPL